MKHHTPTYRVWGLALAGLLAASCTLAGTVANGDFENGLNGWQAVNQGAAQATASNAQPAAGRGCLQLSCTATETSWALGPALPGNVGDTLQINFSARQGQGKATLLLSLVADAGGLTGAPLWESTLPADAAWHKVSLLIKTPPAGEGTPRLAFGVVGAAGSWQVDEVDAVPGKLGDLLPVKPTGDTPGSETLPENWQPEGLLDARTKEIAGKPELLLDVNGIEVGLQPEMTVRRGFREGMVLYAVNRGQKAKDLIVKMAGPSGVECPQWTLPVHENGTTRFHVMVQSQRVGQFWGKFTAKSAEDEKSAPVKITCQSAFPAPALIWRGRAEPQALAAARKARIDLHILATSPDSAAFQPLLAALQGQGQTVIAPLLESLTPLQYLPAMTRLYADLKCPFWLAAPDDREGATLGVLGRLISDLRQAQADGWLFSPPVPLARDWQKRQLLPVKAAQVTAERLAGVVSVAVQPPLLPPACVLQQTVDGKADVPNGAMVALDGQTDLQATRQLLASRNLALPLLVGPLQALPGADDRLSALQLARAMTNALSQGATGVTLETASGPRNGLGLLPAQAQAGETAVQQVVRMLSDELVGAAPIVPLADSPGVATTPDATVCYKPFLRGGEGIVVLWNNTSAPKDVTVEFRFEPVVARRLVLSYQGEFATRRWDPIMQFPEEAFKRGRPAIFVRLDPLQVQVHTFRLLTPEAAWLRKVELTQPLKPTTAVEIPTQDTRSWWTVMLGRKRTNP